MINSLYIHIPFCDCICSYCDFPKILSSTKFQDKYLKTLIDEIDSFNIEDNSLKTIYIGGGTPSSLNIEQLDYLLSYLHRRFQNVEEFSFEANPESLTEDKIVILKKYGVNRVSLGVQSIDDSLLKLMNRRHNKFDVMQCITNLRKHGIDNFNLDFIYGINEREESFIDADIDFAINSKSTHLSFYSLQVEEGTLLYNKGFCSLDDDKMATLYEKINSRLEQAGYYRYEVSNFAKPGFESKHNLTYWHDEEYYAAGLGASSYVGNKRHTNTKSMTEYLKNNSKAEDITITEGDEEFEFLMLNLRLVSGFSLQVFNERFKKDFLTSYKDNIEKVKDYVEVYDGFFRIKKEYIYTMDSILLELLKLPE